MSYSCPSCGFLTFIEQSSYEICSICDWENDPIQEKNPDFKGGANDYSLRESQNNVLKLYPLYIKEYNGFERDSNFKLLKIE